MPVLGDLGPFLTVCLLFAVAVQFTDEHGEVCPANWTPGAATMKADPEKSKVSCCCCRGLAGCWARYAGAASPALLLIQDCCLMSWMWSVWIL